MFEPEVRLARGRARCSLWWTGTPMFGHHRTGLIGEYAAEDDASAGRLLSDALDRLSSNGCTFAIGPMDGSVWDHYRFVTVSGLEPPFLMEPNNPDSWPRQFASAAFQPVARYYSALNPDVNQPDVRPLDAEPQGMAIRHLLMDRFDAEASSLYPIAIAAFQHGFLFRPVSERAFIRRYQAFRPLLRPELVLIAESGGEPCGFLLAMPEPSQPGTLVVRTVAVTPECAGKGVGRALVAHVHAAAAACGFRRAIHAFMHESNPSRNISAHTARTIREYTLFGRKL